MTLSEFLSLDQPHMYFVWSAISLWLAFSIYYMIRVNKLGTQRVIFTLYDAIPSAFTTLGIFGTFLGIFIGLQNFDVDNIDEGIPHLLEGMKTAFSTSIVGIALSLLVGKISKWVYDAKEKRESTGESEGELDALNEILKALTSGNETSNKQLQTLNNSLIGETDSSLGSQLIKLQNRITELALENSEQKDQLTSIKESLGGDGDTSLLVQIQKLRAEQTDYAQESRKNIEFIVEAMKANNEVLQTKFDEFSELLKKNNTEALVEVMKAATEKFNDQMSALIEKLVKENFQELNNSVQRMNTWQQDNKEMIAELTSQFKSVSSDFKITSESIKEITTNTSQLTDSNSHLTRLIEELQKVMIEDTKYQEIVGQLTTTIETLKENTDAFDETTDKLNNWVKNQMNFSDSVSTLLTRLEEIDRIKDINEMFWNDTRKQLNEGVGMIREANTRLADDIRMINDEFEDHLSRTLRNLDELIRGFMSGNGNRPSGF